MTSFTDILQVGDLIYTVEVEKDARHRDVPSAALDMLITYIRTGNWPKFPEISICEVDPCGLIANREHLPERVWRMISPVVYEAIAKRKPLEWLSFDEGSLLRIYDAANPPPFGLEAA